MLLIRAPIEKMYTRKSSQMTETAQKQNIGQKRKPRLTKDSYDVGSDLNNSIPLSEKSDQDKKKEDCIISDDMFKIDMDLVRQIRREFVQSRIIAEPIGSGLEENSIFFIEQNFLAHK